MTELAVRPKLDPEERSVEELAATLDAATQQLAQLDPLQQRAAKELNDAWNDAHRAALVQIVRGLRQDPRGKELLFELVDVPAVRMVLLMHGIIRPDPMTLAREALESVRPQLQSHGGDVELDRIEDGTAYVRLSGACNGCSMSAVTMRNGVEQALKERVPGVLGVEVLPNEPGPALIPLSEIGRRLPEGEKGWCKTHELGSFPLGELVTVVLEADGIPRSEAVVVNLDGQLSAFVNECAHLGMSLDDAELDVVDGTLTCSWHGFCYDARSGECTSLPGAQLRQLPLRVDNGFVWVRAEV